MADPVYSSVQDLPEAESLSENDVLPLGQGETALLNIALGALRAYILAGIDLPADGVDGRTILSGDGAPVDELGRDGDFYFDVPAVTIYGPKVSGAWPAGRALSAEGIEAFAEAAAASATAANSAAAAAEGAQDIAVTAAAGVGTRTLVYNDAIYSHAIVDSDGNIFALIERNTGRIKLSLAPDSIVPLGGGAVFEALNDQSGWIFQIRDTGQQVLAGLRLDGRASISLADDAIVPSAAILAGLTAPLRAAKQSIPSNRLCFSGDSLFTTSGASNSLPQLISAALGMPYVSTATGGTKSGSIAVRQGGLPMKLTLAGNLPASTDSVDVTAYSEEYTNSQGSQNPSGTLAGIPVVLRRIDDGAGITLKYTVNRVSAAASATAIPALTPFIPAVALGNEGDFHFIQAGRNDDRATRAQRVATRDNILRMIDRIGHDRFGVLSIKNGAGEGNPSSAYTQIMEANLLIQQAVGWHFCDTRKYLASAGALADAAISPTEQDNMDVAADTIPASLRLDGIHGTDASHIIEAAYIARWHRGHGFATGPSF